MNHSKGFPGGAVVKNPPAQHPPIKKYNIDFWIARSHSDWREMVPHCGFDLHFSNKE